MKSTSLNQNSNYTKRNTMIIITKEEFKLNSSSSYYIINQKGDPFVSFSSLWNRLVFNFIACFGLVIVLG